MWLWHIKRHLDIASVSMESNRLCHGGNYPQRLPGCGKLLLRQHTNLPKINYATLVVTCCGVPMQSPGIWSLAWPHSVQAQNGKFISAISGKNEFGFFSSPSSRWASVRSPSMPIGGHFTRLGLALPNIFCFPGTVAYTLLDYSLWCFIHRQDSHRNWHFSLYHTGGGETSTSQSCC